MGLGALLDDFLRGILTEGIIDGLMYISGGGTIFFGSESNAELIAKTPAEFNSTILTLMQNISENVILTIAGLVLTYVAVYELYQMVVERNNLEKGDISQIYFWAIKTFFAIILVTNAFDIMMAMFDVAQWAIKQSIGIVADISQQITFEGLAAQLASMSIGKLIGLCAEVSIAKLVMQVMSVVVFVIIYSRMIRIYLTTSIAPIPFATFLNKEQGQIGQNFLRTIAALAFQGFFMMLCLAIYSVLVQTSIVSAENGIANVAFQLTAYAILLAVTLGQTGNLSQSIFSAH